MFRRLISLIQYHWYIHLRTKVLLFQARDDYDGHQLVVAEAKKLFPDVCWLLEKRRGLQILMWFLPSKTQTWEWRLCWSIQMWHQLVVNRKKIVLSSIVRLLCVGEEARAGNINGAQLLGRELLLGWSWGGSKSTTSGEDTLDPCVNTFLKWICLVHTHCLCLKFWSTGFSIQGWKGFCITFTRDTFCLVRSLIIHLW